MSKKILIVDGYSTSRYLVTALNELGFECAHIRSEEEPPPALACAFSSEGYLTDYGYIGPVQQALSRLSQEMFEAVIPGSEPGVEYAESFSTLLELRTNEPDRSIARRNKVAMADAVALSGLRTARHAFVQTTDEAINFALHHGEWPVVVKPVDSAGSDGVHFCHTPSDIQRAMSLNLGKTNLLGLQNNGLMIQEFLNGRQFFFNTVSRGGKHLVTDGWERRTRDVLGFANVLEDWLLVDPTEPEIKDCISYSLQVFDALGIQNSAAVTEVRLTESGPVLIETGARLNGPTMEPKPYLAAGLPETQAMAWARSLADPDDFAKTLEDAPIYRVEKNAAISSELSCLIRLPSWNATYSSLAPGDTVTPTTTTIGLGGFVYWVHPEAEVIKSDLATFRDLETKDQLYKIEQGPLVAESAT